MEENDLMKALNDFEKKVLKMVDGYFSRTGQIHAVQLLKTKDADKNEFSSFYCWFNKKTGMYEFSPNKKVVGIAIQAAAAKLGFIPNETSYNNVLHTYTKCRKVRFEKQLNTK
ncbi:hypothetical protein [Aquitalea pelogenes]|uniref:hypothetical protein n=1 Tax=Aquitalea pelogenes TaxID=1293573 RepID=UPI0035B3C818